MAQALEATRFDDATQHSAAGRNVDVARGSEAALVHCPYFNTDLLDIDGITDLDLSARDSFTILINVGGDAFISTSEYIVRLPQGTSALVPAALPALTIVGIARLISVYIP